MEYLKKSDPTSTGRRKSSSSTGGVLDSFDIVSIVGALNDEFDIDIHVGNLVPENFNSIEGMMKLIEKLQQED